MKKQFKFIRFTSTIRFLIFVLNVYDLSNFFYLFPSNADDFCFIFIIKLFEMNKNKWTEYF